MTFCSRIGLVCSWTRINWGEGQHLKIWGRVLNRKTVDCVFAPSEWTSVRLAFVHREGRMEREVHRWIAVDADALNLRINLRSSSHRWSRALGSDGKNEMAGTSGWNEFPPRRVRARSSEWSLCSLTQKTAEEVQAFHSCGCEMSKCKVLFFLFRYFVYKARVWLLMLQISRQLTDGCW